MILRGALIGYGFISSRGHIPAYLERQKTKGDVEIVAIADVCEARLRLAKEALPQARIYQNHEELLRHEAGILDFVDISAPPSEHAAIAHAAFDAGLHVLCEKPLTTSLSDAEELLNHAKTAERVLFPVHNYKFAPVVKAIREIIESGRIGKVKAVTLSTYRNTHAKGVTEWNTHWRRSHAFSGGGIAMDHGSHSFYLMFDWMKNYPTSITAKMSNQSEGTYDTEDNFSAVLTFPNGLAHCHLTWTAGIRKVIYTVQGTRGGITVDDDRLEIAIQQKTDGPDVAQGAVQWLIEKEMIPSHWMDASHVSWFNALFDDFIRAIQNRSFVGREAEEAYRCIEIISRAYESSKNRSEEIALDGLRCFQFQTEERL